MYILLQKRRIAASFGFKYKDYISIQHMVASGRHGNDPKHTARTIKNKKARHSLEVFTVKEILYYLVCIYLFGLFVHLKEH